VYWGEDAADFRPSRFIDTDDYKWPRDAFLAFSAGSRGCIGKQAAVVEATAFLARIVAKYKIVPPAEKAEEWKRLPGESEVDRRERIYKVSKGLSEPAVLRSELTGSLFLSQPSHNITLTPASPLNIGFVPRE